MPGVGALRTDPVEGFGDRAGSDDADGSLRVSYFRSSSVGPSYTLAVNDANLTARVCYFPASGVDWVCGGRY